MGWNVIYSSTAGTLSGFPSTLNTSGPLAVSGYYTTNSSNQLNDCIQLNLYKIPNINPCFTKYCFKLPPCDSPELKKPLNNFVPNEVTELNVYPNPAANLINIRFSLAQCQDGVLELLSADGLLIQKKFLVSPSGYAQMDLKEMSPGIYIVKLTPHNGLAIQKKITILK